MPKKRPQTDAEDSTKKPKTSELSDSSDSSFVYGGTTTTTTSHQTEGLAAIGTGLLFPPQVGVPLMEGTASRLNMELENAKKELQQAKEELENTEVKLEKAKTELAEAESRDSPEKQKEAREDYGKRRKAAQSAMDAFLSKQDIVHMFERRRTLNSILAKLTQIHQSSHQHV